MAIRQKTSLGCAVFGVCSLVLLCQSIVLAQNNLEVPGFPNAQYPYAKAPNGCGPGIFTDDRREIRDTYGSVDFTGACNTHDKCYYTLGSRFNVCNERFYSDLRAACERDVPSFLGIPEPVQLSACYAIATSYYLGVQAGAVLGIFNEAQEYQRRYNDAVAALNASRRAPVEISLCNTTSDKLLYGAYTAYYPATGWRSIGWSRIDAGRCVNADLGVGYTGDVYIYAELAGGSAYWSGSDATFCIGRSGAFQISNSDTDTCTSNETRRVGMSKLTTRPGVNIWSFGWQGPTDLFSPPIPTIQGPN